MLRAGNPQPVVIVAGTDNNRLTIFTDAVYLSWDRGQKYVLCLM